MLKFAQKSFVSFKLDSIKVFSHIWVSKQLLLITTFLVQDIHYNGRDLSNDHFAETNKDVYLNIIQETQFLTSITVTISIWSKVCQKD